MNTVPLLEGRGLTVRWRDRVLLADVDCALAPGELVALQGPSGCGKTSLLRLLCGLDDPAPGTVLWRGAPVRPADWPAVRRQAVLVAQEPVLLEGSVAANLARPFRYRHVRRPFPADAARELLARLRLPPAMLDAPAADLSVGERQRVCLARALLLRPAVLLLDEPTSALDPAATAAVEEIVREHAAAGGAALVVTHGREQAARWCHRVVELGGRHA